MTIRFRNRTEAGQLLGKKLAIAGNYKDALVVALPRGGVPVAFEVARILHLPLDICIVRKLGVPGHKELAMGAIASGGVRVLNYDVIGWKSISNHSIEKVAAQELQELQRRDRAYRGNRPPLNVRDRQVILIDDGIATGSTIKAAISILQQQQPQSITVAVPVAPPPVCRDLATIVDKVVCLSMPEAFYAIGLWYDNFTQTTDDEVRQLLEESAFDTTPA